MPEVVIEEGPGNSRSRNRSSPLAQTETAIAIANVKSVAEQPALLSNLAFSNLLANVNLSQQNAVSNQQSLNEVGVSVVGKVVQLLTSLGPLEAMSTSQLFTGNMVAEDIADLKAAVSAKL